ncbi:MAG TPA: YciI family protein, partial [Gemmatimonadaceae bacterium]
MKFLVLIYNEPELLNALPSTEFDTTMRGCFNKADQLKKDGKLLDSRMLQAPSTAKSIRVRNGRRTTHDGPFAETKEVLGGFNLIEAENMDE